MDGPNGIGDVIVKHNFTRDTLQYTDTTDCKTTIPLTYAAPSTDDELQSLLTSSQRCVQTIEAQEHCLNQISWTSLSKDTWHFDLFEGFVELLYNRLVLCAYSLFTGWLQWEPILWGLSS